MNDDEVMQWLSDEERGEFINQRDRQGVDPMAFRSLAETRKAAAALVDTCRLSAVLGPATASAAIAVDAMIPVTAPR